MKSIKFYVIIAALAFSMASCVESSDKYKAAIAERDSLALEKQALDSNYSRTLTILDDIEKGFSEISYSQSQMRVNLDGSEGKTTSKRELIAAQMADIKETIEINKAKIEELKALASKEGKVNKILSATIQRLQTEMDNKNIQIKNLQEELEMKNIKITELSTTVNDQSKNIAEQKSLLEQQKSSLQAQDADLNSAWYCVATYTKLKEAKIITNTGLFKSKKVLKNEFDESVFTKIDLRTILSIATGSKSVKIISSHPQSSYKLVTGADKKITIEISSPSKFWSVTKYLVVQI